MLKRSWILMLLVVLGSMASTTLASVEENDDMLQVKNEGTVLVAVSAKAPESGAHGAIVITKATLMRGDGSVLDKTPADPILREQGTAVSPAVTGTVQSAPTFSAAGGAGGEDVYDVVLDTGEGASFSVGDYVRSQTANLGGIYRVNAISTDTLSLEAAENEMDVANGATIEAVTPEKWYRATVAVTYANLNGLPGELEFQIDGYKSDVRLLKPAITVAINERTREYLQPQIDNGDVKVI